MYVCRQGRVPCSLHCRVQSGLLLPAAAFATGTPSSDFYHGRRDLQFSLRRVELYSHSEGEIYVF